jgi:hypothetical protein
MFDGRVSERKLQMNRDVRVQESVGILKLTPCNCLVQAYLSGVPLPMHRNPVASQSQHRAVCTKEETLLHRQNKLLMAALSEADRQEVVMDIRRYDYECCKGTRPDSSQ